MKTVVALAFVLAAVFVAIESESPPEIPFPYKRCYDSLRDCTAPLSDNPLLRSIAGDSDKFFEHIDEICEIYRTAANCVRPNVDSCDLHRQTGINATLSIVDFVCSDEGRSLIREFRKSDCYHNSEKVNELQRLPTGCIDEAVANNEPTGDEEENGQCLLIADAIECVVRETTNKCGEVAGRIAEGVARPLITVITPQQCTAELADEFVRRTLDDVELTWDLKRTLGYFKRSG